MNNFDDEDIESSSDLSGFIEFNNQSAGQTNTSSDDVTEYSGYDDYNYDDYYEDEFYKLLLFPFETKLLGIVRPALILLTVLSNTFVAQFFLCMKNRRKASNLLFVSIAFSDTMTGIALLPNSLYVFAGNRAFLSKTWCTVFMTSKLIISRTFHTVSVWQTVVLAIQRHLCVSHPFISGRFCTYWKTFSSIVVIYFLAFCLHVYHLFNEKATHGECTWRIEKRCHIACIYLWASIILQNLLPCLILLLLTTSTLRSLNKASSRLSVMSGGQIGSNARSSRDKIITITAILIVIMFLIPELPYGIYMVFLVITLPRGQMVNQEQNHLVIAIYDIILIITFHVNFWIYCSTMSDFRNAFLFYATCGRRPYNTAGNKCSRTSSARSVRSNVSRTSSSTSRNRILSQTTSVMSTSSENYIHSAEASTDGRRHTQATDSLRLGNNTEPTQRSRKTVKSTQNGAEHAANCTESINTVKYLPHGERNCYNAHGINEIASDTSPTDNNDVFM